MSCRNLIFIFWVLISSSLFSQTNFNYRTPTYLDEDTGKFFLEIDNNNFILNTEYLNNIVEGYTLLGFNLAPRLTYYANKKIKLSAGVNIMSYYRREEETNIDFLLTFQYKISPKFDFILGNIYGTTNHNLIEPLFHFERLYTNNIENGMQFLWNGKRLKLDLWLDWEQQIFQGDSFQEEYNVGLSTKLILVDNDDILLSIPFQNLVRHQGGEVNYKNKLALSIYNNALGLSIQKKFNYDILNNIALSSYWVNYQDLKTTKQQMYVDGMGSYTTYEMNHTNYSLQLGYWYGKQYIAPIGNPIFESYSRTSFFIEEPKKHLLTGKLSLQKELITGIKLGGNCGTYYDLRKNIVDYYWHVVVVFNGKIFL